MKKRLDKQSIFGAFQIKGTKDESEYLMCLLDDILKTKSGKELIMDVLKSDYVSKPIYLEFVSQDKIGGFQGHSHHEKGISLEKRSPKDNENEKFCYFQDVITLTHELYHLKIAKNFQPLYEQTSLSQVVYAHLTNEAYTYAFQTYVFEKELGQIYPEFQQNTEGLPVTPGEFIKGWMHGMVPSTIKYVDDYLANQNIFIWRPAMESKKFMHQLAPFQYRKKALPLESFPWYTTSKSGGYYLVGGKSVLEVSEKGAPVYLCTYLGNGDFSSVICSEVQEKLNSGMTPSKRYTGIAKRPLLPIECEQIQFYLADKISQKDIHYNTDLILPPTARNMTDVVTWRESFIPTKIRKKVKKSKTPNDPKICE